MPWGILCQAICLKITHSWHLSLWWHKVERLLFPRNILAASVTLYIHPARPGYSCCRLQRYEWSNHKNTIRRTTYVYVAVVRGYVRQLSIMTVHVSITNYFLLLFYSSYQTHHRNRIIFKKLHVIITQKIVTLRHGPPVPVYSVLKTH
jgi:hypothetical protein